MADTYYPPLEQSALTHLTAIRMHLAEDPNYLDNAPYEDGMKTQLLQMLSVRSQDEVTSLTDDDVEAEVESLYRNMKKFSEDLEGVDVKDQAAIFRVATALTEKLINLRERSSKIKEWKEFLTKIVAMFDDLEPDLRTRFMDEIKEFTQ